MPRSLASGSLLVQVAPSNSSSAYRRQYAAPPSEVTWNRSRGVSWSSWAWIETNGSRSIPSPPSVEKSTMAFARNPGSSPGISTAASTAIAATCRTPRTDEDHSGRRRDAVHIGPHCRTRRSPSEKTTASTAVEEHDRVDRAGAVLEHRVGEPDERHRGQDRQQWAAGADRERVRGERGGPHRRHGSEHQRWERGGGRDLDLRLLAHELERSPDRPKGAERRESIPGRLREDEPRERQDEAGEAREGGQEQPAALEERRDEHRPERRHDEPPHGRAPDEHAPERERRRRAERCDRRES